MQYRIPLYYNLQLHMQKMLQIDLIISLERTNASCFPTFAAMVNAKLQMVALFANVTTVTPLMQMDTIVLILMNAVSGKKCMV